MTKRIPLLLGASLVSGILSGAFIYLVFPLVFSRFGAEDRLFFSLLLGGLVGAQFIIQAFQEWRRR